ncbi:MAG TPA: VanZ family protein [Bacteroidia bacterium]|nr:VanZ family protein [Bacteroidia bacterium]
MFSLRNILSNKGLFQAFFWIWLILIFIFSSVPDLPVPEKKIADLFRTDYLIHFFQYMVLAFFFVIAKGKTFFPLRTFLIFWLTGTFIGTIDELHQLFIPGRAFNIRDMLLNSAGFLFGTVLTAYLLLIIFPSDKKE